MKKLIVILGSGESGTGAALLAKKQGYETFVSDAGRIAPAFREQLDQAGIDWEEGAHNYEKIYKADEIIKSPGIPESNNLIKELRAKNIPIISEIEFAARYTNAFKICITGTNGKTTTTSLVYHLLKKAGLKVAVGGNIGTSFARLVADENTYDYYVLELSSFQLDDMYEFKAELAILTNITPDHLDRYDYNIQNYIDSKFRITRNQNENDSFIYCADDELTMKNIDKYSIKAQKFSFSCREIPERGAASINGNLHIQTDNNKSNLITMLTTELSLKGIHNAYNSMAAGIVGQALHIRKDVIREALSDFQNVEHRLEKVADVRGIEFINDSKATNVNSAWYALESMDKPIVWIAGGTDKGNDYTMLNELVRDKVRIIVCLGIDNHKLHEAFGKDVDMIVNTSSAKEAVNVAYKLAHAGEAVLLSPACASFDLFKNYEDRGRQFKQAVRDL